jgi:hypothetical protein
MNVSNSNSNPAGSVGKAPGGSQTIPIAKVSQQKAQESKFSPRLIPKIVIRLPNEFITSRYQEPLSFHRSQRTETRRKEIVKKALSLCQRHSICLDFNINFEQFFAIISRIQWIERIEITRKTSIPHSRAIHSSPRHRIIKSRNKAEAGMFREARKRAASS